LKNRIKELEALLMREKQSKGSISSGYASSNCYVNPTFESESSYTSLPSFNNIKSEPSDSRRLSIISTTSNNSTNSRIKAVPDGAGRFFACADEEGFDFHIPDSAIFGDVNSEDYQKRVKELQWRNSLMPMHLKSSYPNEEFGAKAEPIDENLLKGLPGVRLSTLGYGANNMRKTISGPVGNKYEAFTIPLEPPRKFISGSVSIYHSCFN
jgi:hypothetical protein